MRFLDLFWPNLPEPGNRYIIPGQGEFGKWHPRWGREYRKTFFLQCSTVYVVTNSLKKWIGSSTEQRDWEAHAHKAIVFLAPIEKYFSALGLDPLAPSSKLHGRVWLFERTKIWDHPCFCGLVVECWLGNLKNESNPSWEHFFPS